MPANEIDYVNFPKIFVGSERYRKIVHVNQDKIIYNYQLDNKNDLRFISYFKITAYFSDGQILPLGFIADSELNPRKGSIDYLKDIEGWSVDSILPLLDRTDFATSLFASKNKAFFGTLIKVLIEHNIWSKQSLEATKILAMDRKSGYGFRMAILSSFFKTTMDIKAMTKFIQYSPDFLLMDILSDVDLDDSPVAHDMLQVLYYGFIKENQLSKPISRTVLRVLLANGHIQDSHLRLFIVHQVPRERLMAIFEFLKLQGSKGVNVLYHLFSEERIFQSMTRERFVGLVSLINDDSKNTRNLVNGLRHFKILQRFKDWHFLALIDHWIENQNFEAAVTFVQSPIVMPQLRRVIGEARFKAMHNFLKTEMHKTRSLNQREWFFESDDKLPIGEETRNIPGLMAINHEHYLPRKQNPLRIHKPQKITLDSPTSILTRVPNKSLMGLSRYGKIII
jgi:hypothetical protein